MHQAADTEPLGIEMHGFAYAFSTLLEALNNATFYRFTIVNLNTKAIRKTYFGIFSDPDLGDAGDDYVGSDTLRQMGFVYNSTDNDLGGEGYGRAPPAVGYRILRGPRADDDGVDNDRDGTIDEPDERPGMSHFLYYNNGGGPNEDPSTGEDYYNFLRALWKNGVHLQYGGDGYREGSSAPPANYMYSGDPVTGSYWSEVNTDDSGTAKSSADRRFIISSGPFDLIPGESKSLDFAVVYGRGDDNLDSITELRHASDGVQAAFDDGFSELPPGERIRATVRPVFPADGQTDVPRNVSLKWDPALGGVGYKVMIVSKDWKDVQTSTTTELVPRNLRANTLYFWRVRAATEYGSGPWSEWRFFVTGAGQPAGTPRPIFPGDGSQIHAAQIVLRWTARGTNERIQLSNSPDFSNLILDETGVESGLLFEAEPFRRYYWRVSDASNEEGGWSDTWMFTTLDSQLAGGGKSPVAELRNFPNPASESTTLQFFLRIRARVKLTISDAVGRPVFTLIDGYRSAGIYELPLDTSRLSSGLYFYTLTAEGSSSTRALVVTRQGGRHAGGPATAELVHSFWTRIPRSRDVVFPLHRRCTPERVALP